MIQFEIIKLETTLPTFSSVRHTIWVLNKTKEANSHRRNLTHTENYLTAGVTCVWCTRATNGAS